MELSRRPARGEPSEGASPLSLRRWLPGLRSSNRAGTPGERDRQQVRPGPARDVGGPSGQASADLWAVVGLGNPGPGYAANRHNVGAMVIDLLRERFGGRFSAHRGGRADVATGRLAEHRLILVRPRAYMNESGGGVAAVRDYYKVDPERLVVVHDELDLPFGALRLKFGGGDGGHNGLRSLRRSLGTGDFFRVRVGIGRPPGRMDPAVYVLRDFSASERKELDEVVDRAADAVEALVVDGLERAQNAYNS